MPPLVPPLPITAPVLVLIALAVAGCGSAGNTPHTDPSPSPSPSPIEPADGTDVSACSDGECEVEVTGPTEFEIALPHGPAMLAVDSITEGQVYFIVSLPSEEAPAAQTIVAPGDGFGFSGTRIDVVYLDAADGSAILRIEQE